jgi:hypothetical protein
MAGNGDQPVADSSSVQEDVESGETVEATETAPVAPLAQAAGSAGAQEPQAGPEFAEEPQQPALVDDPLIDAGSADAIAEMEPLPAEPETVVAESELPEAAARSAAPQLAETVTDAQMDVVDATDCAAEQAVSEHKADPDPPSQTDPPAADTTDTVDTATSVGECAGSGLQESSAAAVSELALLAHNTGGLLSQGFDHLKEQLPPISLARRETPSSALPGPSKTAGQAKVEQSGASPASQAVAPASSIILRNPASNGGVVHFLAGRELISLAAGHERELEPVADLVVRFDRGGGLGQTRQAVVAGTYEFRVSSNGWRLERVDYNGPK